MLHENCPLTLLNYKYIPSEFKLFNTKKSYIISNISDYGVYLNWSFGTYATKIWNGFFSSSERGIL